MQYKILNKFNGIKHLLELFFNQNFLTPCCLSAKAMFHNCPRVEKKICLPPTKCESYLLEEKPEPKPN